VTKSKHTNDIQHCCLSSLLALSLHQVSVLVLFQVELVIMTNNDDGLASGRERRSNAGARMSRLLDAEDDDDFYKTTYGGFNEVGIIHDSFMSIS